MKKEIRLEEEKYTATVVIEYEEERLIDEDIIEGHAPDIDIESVELTEFKFLDAAGEEHEWPNLPENMKTHVEEVAVQQFYDHL